MHVIFNVYFIFCFYFNFQLLITFTLFFKLHCIFSPNNYKKHTKAKLNGNPAWVRQPPKNSLHGEKSSHLTEISSERGEFILIYTIGFYKVEFTILPGCHSGWMSHFIKTASRSRYG